MNKSEYTNTKSLQEQIISKFIGGAIAGVVGVSVIYPLDMVKTRLQNQKPLPGGKLPYSGMLDCFKQLIAKNGPRGLYRGLAANLSGITPEKAIKLAVNDIMRDHFAKKNNCSPNTISLKHSVLSGAIAGFCQVIATNPMEIVKIQMQIGVGQKTTDVVRNLGIRGLYRGTSATLLRDVPFSVIFFPLSKILQNAITTNKESPSFSSIFVGSVLAGITASVAVTPVDVIKTRLQASGTNSGIIQTGREVYQNFGIKGLFKGAIPRALTTAPLFGIALITFELQQRFFP